MIEHNRQRPHVVIAGGGVAALETLLALRSLADGQFEITLLAPEPWFVYQPVTVGEAFGRSEAHTYALSFIASEHEATLVPGSIERVDVSGQTVFTESGQRLKYDKLVVAVGAQRREALPGALTFAGRGTVPALRGLLEELESGAAGSVAFALPSERVWPLPLYELAVMTAEHLSTRHAEGVEVTFVTPEEKPLGLFGTDAAEAVATLLAERSIVLRCSATPVAVRPGSLALTGGGSVSADRVVSMPVPEGPALRGLPHDGDGFMTVDRHGRVRGAEGVFAAGDVTAFPLKQGGLAAQQADAAAEQIAADLGVALAPEPFRPVLRGLLMTGGPPLYLRAESPDMTQISRFVAQAERLERGRQVVSTATRQPLWWPPAKVAGRYLAPYLAEADPEPVPSELADLVEVDGPAVPEAEQTDAFDLALVLADMDARWGDYRSALEALGAAEAAWGALPPDYEARRRKWRHAQMLRGG